MWTPEAEPQSEKIGLYCLRSVIFPPNVLFRMLLCSGAGTNLKVGGGTCFSRVPPLFLALCVRFGERFRDGQYSLVSFLFAVLPLTVPPVPGHL